MQIRSDFTKDELIKGDPLTQASHPISKLMAVGELILGIDHGESDLDIDKIHGISAIIKDATKEIEYLIDCHYKQAVPKDCNRIDTLERTMENFISYLEDPDDEPDLKIMAVNLRKQLEH